MSNVLRLVKTNLSNIVDEFGWFLYSAGHFVKSCIREWEFSTLMILTVAVILYTTPVLIWSPEETNPSTLTAVNVNTAFWKHEQHLMRVVDYMEKMQIYHHTSHKLIALAILLQITAFVLLFVAARFHARKNLLAYNRFYVTYNVISMTSLWVLYIACYFKTYSPRIHVLEFVVCYWYIYMIYFVLNTMTINVMRAVNEKPPAQTNGAMLFCYNDYLILTRFTDSMPVIDEYDL